MKLNKSIIFFIFIFITMSATAVSAANSTDMATNVNDNIELTQTGDSIGNYTESLSLIEETKTGNALNLKNDYINDDEINNLIIDEETKIDENYVLDANFTSSTKNATYEHVVKTFDDVQNAIDNAKENDTIELNGTYYGNGREIAVEKSLTFQGRENATFDAHKLSRIFLITSSDVIFKNINFINGNFNDTTYYYDGGIIKSIEESSMTFINCRFVNNTVLGNGGVIFDCGKKISIVNCTFISNSASDGGAIFSEMAEISIDNSTFISNSASDCGGVIELDMASLIINNSQFITNTASNGGAIHSNGFVSVNNSTFIKNHASGPGGSISLDWKLELINSTFIENKAAYGGAVYLSTPDVGPNLSIINSRFIRNSAELGGASYLNFKVYNDPGYIISENGDANLKENVFENNTAEIAGAIFISGNLNISDSVFENNYADKYGSINIASGTVNISDCSFKNNSKRNIHLTFTSDFEGYIFPGKLIIGNATYTSEAILDNELPTIKVTINKINTYYNSGKLLTVKLTDFKSKDPVTGHISLKVGKKTYDLKTNKEGVATFKASTLSVRKYSVTVTHKTGDKYLAIADTFSTINVKKASTTVKAPKITAKYKKTKYFKITVKNKATKKAVKNTYVKVKIDKKTYKLKTNSKGIAKFNTKKIKIGKHKVSITSGNTNYQMSGKSTITIKK